MIEVLLGRNRVSRMLNVGLRIRGWDVFFFGEILSDQAIVEEGKNYSMMDLEKRRLRLVESQAKI